ncbi:methyltransferase domain-containing protein [Psychrosphaera sp. B3R10]|uniref:tRNA 5-carboxymethoxyuridine methyltransferase n=1 Tax=Psychrosphaera algicola TaxID=3023714 RepID=A0ABT5F913_9GAMM|nr:MULTISPECIES: methyltransferase domain-containing protein [unclassified Psychrosphaera]MBU2881374.1 methyltransferase domain-containing protein [Psychrosphaera sp. I2R16]MBU2988473.1 methyltransferase domain-containing protein [Psychrosphaera sp. B3R10]MDC2888015.1 methyltransferase domain-containing protein [Psychrosphaera sp. G1-22]MDO6720027.1 methyltransferase domain-containing protein [Psychrosphaera sp. 1_MG-2023]
MKKQDTSFSKSVDTFKNNIYGSSKGQVREAVLLRDLESIIHSKQKLNIIDVGGGQGQIALKLAQQGHNVTICDISEEMLDVAKNKAIELNISDKVAFIHCPLQELPSKLQTKFDVVLCHAVFEWLADPQAAFKILADYLTDKGQLSLMFYNANGQIMSNLVYGNFDYIEAGFNVKKAVRLNPQNALMPDTVKDWAKQAGLSLCLDTGVRCFHDYMRNREQWTKDINKIVEMELTYSTKEPFASIARYKHFIFKAN